MTVHEITPAVDPNTLLPGAQFADAYRIEVDDRTLNARQAAERMLARQPRWAEAADRPHAAASDRRRSRA
jgi:hypothetical protein